MLLLVEKHRARVWYRIVVRPCAHEAALVSADCAAVILGTDGQRLSVRTQCQAAAEEVLAVRRMTLHVSMLGPLRAAAGEDIDGAGTDHADVCLVAADALGIALLRGRTG